MNASFIMIDIHYIKLFILFFWNHYQWKYDIGCSKNLEFRWQKFKKYLGFKVGLASQSRIWFSQTFVRTVSIPSVPTPQSGPHDHGRRWGDHFGGDATFGMFIRPTLFISLFTWKRSLRQFYRQRGKDLAFLWAYSIYILVIFKRVEVPLRAYLEDGNLQINFTQKTHA